MSVSLTNITGGAQTGFTTPGYNVAVDTAVDFNSKQWYVSAVTGTQAGVTAHAGPSSPFTVAVWKPRVLKPLQWNALNSVGILTSVPRNNYGVAVRKGLTCVANQPQQVGLVRIQCEIPAGAEVTDPANVRAMISCAIGALNQISAGLGDTAVSGAL